MKPFTFVLALVLATCQMPLRDSEARPWDALHCGRTDLAHLPQSISWVRPAARFAMARNTFLI